MNLFRDEAQFGISFTGMEQDVTFQSLLPGLMSGEVDGESLHIQGYNLTTDKCLPTAETTDHAKTGAIVTIKIICLLSCVFDAYASRLRAKICNICFNFRAVERALYLYKQIQTGREIRRIQTHMIVSRELVLRDRWAEFNRFCACIKISEHCPSCNNVLKDEDKKPLKVTVNNEDRDTYICADCFQDTVASKKT